MGPTNSGKTRQAIEALEKAENGIYCAPLRLLAWEIAEKLRSKGKVCNLHTGQEQENFFNPTVMSCTIQATNYSKIYDVAVIDEIQ